MCKGVREAGLSAGQEGSRAEAQGSWRRGAQACDQAPGAFLLEGNRLPTWSLGSGHVLLGGEDSGVCFYFILFFKNIFSFSC